MNFGLLAAEIISLVWGTPANFNGFRVLAALLHGTQVVAVSETAVLNRGRHLYIFGTAAITLGIGPHSSFLALIFGRAQKSLRTTVGPISSPTSSRAARSPNDF